jgi:DNA-binding Lrp family transcriptional regulator
MGSNPILAARGRLQVEMATDQGNDLGYTGLHAFVFIDGADPGRNVADVIEDIGGTEGREFPNGRVMFASVTVGAHKGFAHVRAEEGDLGALQRLIFEDLWAEGVRCEHAIEGPLYTPQGVNAKPKAPKRKSPPFCALVRVRTDDDPIAVMNEIARGFGDTDPFQGASVTFGSADLLVELAGDSLDAVDGPVLDVIRGTPGVVWTKTLFAYSEPWRARP